MVTIFEYEYDKSQRNKDYCFSNTTVLFLQRTSKMKKVFVGYFKRISVRIKKTTKNSIQKTKNGLNSFRIQYAISNH